MLFPSYLRPASCSSEVLKGDPQGSIADARGECRAQLSHENCPVAWGSVVTPACSRLAGPLGRWRNPAGAGPMATDMDTVHRDIGTGEYKGAGAKHWSGRCKDGVSRGDGRFLSPAYLGPTRVCMSSPSCPLPRRRPNHHLLASELTPSAFSPRGGYLK